MQGLNHPVIPTISFVPAALDSSVNFLARGLLLFGLSRYELILDWSNY